MELQTAIADYEAARRRVERDAARTAEETRLGLVLRLLPVMDNLDRSVAHGDGTQLIRDQLAEVLRGYGLERFDAVGERFDPRRHEAMDLERVEDPALDGIVTEQWEAGYRVGDRVIRPARVRVGRY
jgi:molecular chaperone GrpE